MKTKSNIRLRSAISRSVLQFTLKKNLRGRQYLFIKDRSGAYHALTECTVKDALRDDFGIDESQIKKLNTRAIAKKFLGV